MQATQASRLQRYRTHTPPNINKFAICAYHRDVYGAFISLALILIAAAVLLFGAAVLMMARMLLRPMRMSDARAAWLLKRLSPGDLGLAYESLRFDIRDAQNATTRLSIAAWWIAHPNNAGKTVVLIHGYGDAKVGAIAWAPTWHSLGFNILAIDLRAHGESGGKYCTAGYFERHDLNQVLDQLLAAHASAARTLVLFGVSLGAAVALATGAIRESNDIDAIIVESVFADYRHAVMRHAQIMNMPAPILQRAAMRVAEWISGARFDDVRPVDMLQGIRCPTMIIQGCDDPFVPEEDKAELQRAMANRDSSKSLYVQLESGHVMGICADVDSYRVQIEGFLAQPVSQTPMPR